MQPRDLLPPYQRRWVDDETRFKFGLWSRQTGKDFSSGEEGIRDCYKHELQKSKTTWLIGAAGERQALESLEKWKEWTEAYTLAIADVVEQRESDEKPHTLIGVEVTGDWNGVMSGVGMVTRDVSIPDPPVDFIQITGKGGVEDYFKKSCTPFYERKFFGIF